MKIDDVVQKYEITIGIECHVQLKTATKLFSGASNDARDEQPNTTVSPICFGFPGVLPVLNEEALTLAIRAGLALNATIPERSRFERKHYFYPDLPKGYQITQLAEPVIVGGHVDVPTGIGVTTKVRIHHAHLEEDAGKLTHPAGGTQSFVDLNRAGTPLIEIVSEPDIHTVAAARAYAQELYLLMTYADVTYGDLYHGNMRFDVNLSLAHLGSDTLGTRTEIKNLNSFRSVEKAAEYEAIRQAKLLDEGEAIVQETRGWNEATFQTFSQRSKEDAHDYRYFPDADIPPVKIEQERVKAIAKTMPLLPADYRKKWQELELDISVINSLLASSSFASLVTDVLERSTKSHAVRVANWLVSSFHISPEADSNYGLNVLNVERMIELSTMVEDGQLSSTSAKAVLQGMFGTIDTPKVIAERLNLLQQSDENELAKIVDAVLAEPASQKAIEDIRSGNDRAIGYLVGMVMKQSSGKANPGVVSKLVRDKIN
ncbi:MAG: Asp-tRNA(Asn)/Glu-tRNA(Gln) amidotransferase subunit GatB [Candidatus Saccharimonadales bacterium]